jgi:hypothetical protein
MEIRPDQALREVFPSFAWIEVRGEAKEFMHQMYAFVVEGPDRNLYGAVPISTEKGEGEWEGWTAYSPLDGQVDYEQLSAEAIEASGYRLG